MQEKNVSYTTTNTYTTLNTLTNETKYIWLVCHGMGYLSKYFIRYFKDLNPHENYVIAPQAPNKYYQGKDFKHVGASWLTRVDTVMETKNVMEYLNNVVREEELNTFTDKQLICMGYSQGVSIITRWLKQTSLVPHKLILHSGGIPSELVAKDFEYVTKIKTYLVYGNQDEYLTKDRINKEKEKANRLFPHHLDVIEFNGKHEVNTSFINQII